jgi:hypothetical protein
LMSCSARVTMSMSIASSIMLNQFMNKLSAIMRLLIKLYPNDNSSNWKLRPNCFLQKCKH